jgi:Ca-activated chloride channel family protein
VVRLALVLLLVLTACTANSPEQVKLSVLATSELADLGPLLADLRRDTGIELTMEYRGTVEAGAELANFDVAWLSTSRFLRLRDS